MCPWAMASRKIFPVGRPKCLIRLTGATGGSATPFRLADDTLKTAFLPRPEVTQRTSPAALCPCAMSVLSRRRYDAIASHVRSLVPPETADAILRHVCSVMRFDPDVGMVTPRRAEATRLRLARIAASEGVNLHDAAMGRAERERRQAAKRP